MDDSTLTSRPLMPREMMGHDLQWWLDRANIAYLWALCLGAVSAVLIAGTSWAIIQWQSEIQNEKDQVFEKYKTDASLKIASAIARANEAELALEKFKAPRGLSSKQFEIFKSRMARFAGAKIDIIIFGETPEMIGIATILFKALVMAKWDVPPVRFAFGGGIWSARIPGLEVTTREGSTPDVEKAADELVAALNDSGVATIRGPSFTNVRVPVAYIDPPLSEDTASSIRMCVGNKPQ